MQREPFHFVGPLSLSLCVSASHTQTESIQKTHFKIQDIHLLIFHKLEFVFVCMWHQRAIFKSSICNHAISVIVLFIQIKTWTESTLSVWWSLFVLCLYSNIYFMHSFTKALCVVHFWPLNGQGGVVVFSASFFNTSQCCL